MTLPHLYSNDKHYRDVLDAIVDEIHQSSEQEASQLELMHEIEHLRISTTTVWSTDNSIGSLIFSQDLQHQAPEEVVLRVQGYIVKARLPPILHRSQLGSTPCFAQQSVTITGLGSEDFGKAVMAVMAIHNRFGEGRNERALQAQHLHRDRGYPVLTFSNRYLTLVDHNSCGDTMLPHTLDPQHILRAAVPNGRHMSENEVQYYERHRDHKSFVYSAIEPSRIKPGHLVEIQCSFTTVPVKHGKRSMLMKLHAICILDNTVQKDYDAAVIAKILNTALPPALSLKRKVGYDSEHQMEDTLKRMCIVTNKEHA